MMLAGCFLSGCFLSGCANYINDGSKEMEAGDYDAAIASFEKAIAANKDVALAWRGIGLLRYQQQDYGKAVEALQASLAAGAEETPVIYNILGVCAMQLQDFDQAIRVFDQGLALPESDADYAEVIQSMKFNLVVCYEKKLDWEGAKARIAEYVQLYPDDAEAAREAIFLATR